jgi:hypothetical protein
MESGFGGPFWKWRELFRHGQGGEFMDFKGFSVDRRFGRDWRVICKMRIEGAFQVTFCRRKRARGKGLARQRKQDVPTCL